jgi:transcriptional regulator with XRE-family HTH domain
VSIDKAAIGRRIKEAREATGLSQEALADVLEVHERTVQNYEAGKGKLLNDLPKIADATDSQVRWLLHGSEVVGDSPEVVTRLARLEDQISEIRELLEDRRRESFSRLAEQAGDEAGEERPPTPERPDELAS